MIRVKFLVMDRGCHIVLLGVGRQCGRHRDRNQIRNDESRKEMVT